MWREGVGKSNINGDGLIVGPARHENVRRALSTAHANVVLHREAGRLQDVRVLNKGEN